MKSLPLVNSTLPTAIKFSPWSSLLKAEETHPNMRSIPAPDHPGTSLLCLLQYVSAFLVLGSPDWTQYSSCSPTNGSRGGGGTSDSTFVHTVGWGPSLLQGYTANLCSTCCPPGPPRSFLQCCSIAHHCPACPVTQDYSLPGAGLAFALAECHKVLSACQRPSE